MSETGTRRSDSILMSYDERLPDDFHRWSPEAKRVWLTGGLTQLQMLNYAADQLDLACEFDTVGTMTNRDLARFVVALTTPLNGGGGDAE